MRRPTRPDRIRPHFTRAEVGCRCGCGLMPPDQALDELEELRVEYGKPMIVNRGASCPAHNARIYREANPLYTERIRYGPHTPQEDREEPWGAFDIKVYGADALELLVCAARLGWTGFGANQKGPIHGRYNHLDRLPARAPDRPRPTIWTY